MFHHISDIFEPGCQSNFRFNFFDPYIFSPFFQSIFSTHSIFFQHNFSIYFPIQVFFCQFCGFLFVWCCRFVVFVLSDFFVMCTPLTPHLSKFYPENVEKVDGVVYLGSGNRIGDAMAGADVPALVLRGSRDSFVPAEVRAHVKWNST